MREWWWGRRLMQKGKNPQRDTAKEKFWARGECCGNVALTVRDMTVKSFSTVVRCSRTDTTDKQGQILWQQCFLTLLLFCNTFEGTDCLHLIRFYSEISLVSCFMCGISKLAGLLSLPFFLPLCHPHPPFTLYLNVVFSSLTLFFSTALDVTSLNTVTVGHP